MDDRLAEYKKRLTEEIDRLKSAEPGDQKALNSRRVLSEHLRALSSEVVRERMESLQAHLTSIRGSEVPEAISTAASELAKELPSLTEARNEERLQRMNEILARVTPACLSAKAEADLNPFLKELGSVASEQEGRGDPRLQRSAQKLQAAIRTVFRWQDYLAQREMGNSGRAVAILKSMQDNQDLAIPSAELAKRISELAEPAAADPSPESALQLLAAVKSLDELPNAVSALRRMNYSKGSAAIAQLPQVERLVSAQVALKNGLIGDAFSIATSASRVIHVHTSEPPSWEPEILRLRGLLLQAIVPRLLEIENIPAVEANEDVSAYLLRITTQLVGEGRYAEAARALETYHATAFSRTYNAPPWLSQDIEGLKKFLAAQQLAGAGSMYDAIKALRTAVRTTGRFTPIQAIQTQLNQLESEYPKEAEAATAALENEEKFNQMRTQLLRDAERAMESRLPAEVRSQLRP